MKKMTKKQCLTWCKNLWKWAENKYDLYKIRRDITYVKSKWPGWKRIRKCKGFCSCCQYNYEWYFNDPRSCGKTCLMSSVWGEKEDIKCYDEESPYCDFYRHIFVTEDEYQQNCRDIWQGADRLLKELEE